MEQSQVIIKENEVITKVENGENKSEVKITSEAIFINTTGKKEITGEEHKHININVRENENNISETVISNEKVGIAVSEKGAFVLKKEQ